MKRWIQIIASALVFGLIAGGVMVGLNVAADKAIISDAGSLQIEETVPETSETEAEPENEEDRDTDDRASESATAKEALDVSDIVEEAMPSVVSITNTMLITQRGYSSIFDYFYGGGQDYQYEVPASGSGIIIQQTDDVLLIVTNNHVVEDSNKLSVTFVDGTTVDAEINGTDSSMDVAVITVPLSDIPEETLDAIKVAKLHTEEDLEVGEGVIAIGNALGYGQSVTVGYISALDREIKTEEGTNSGLIQVDAAINPGNSGGALLNMDGEVIGINEAKASGTNVEGMGYSIPISKAMTVIENLSKEKIPEEDQGALGVYVRTISQSASQMYNLPEGAMISGFSDEEMEGYEGTELTPSAAKDAGLMKSDVITAVEGQKVSSGDELQSVIKYYAAGETVTVTYERLVEGEWQEQTAEVKLNHKAADASDDAASDNEAQPGEGEGGLGLPDNGLDDRDGKKGPAEGPKADSPDPKVDEKPASGNEEETPADDGSDEEGNSEIGDIYDLFREFMEQYNN